MGAGNGGTPPAAGPVQGARHPTGGAELAPDGTRPEPAGPDGRTAP